MRRGEVWTVLDAGYASKPRPVVVVQDDAYAAFDSEIVCLMTSFDSSKIPSRVKIEPSEANGLVKTSFVMTDKILAIRKDRFGDRLVRCERRDGLV